MKVVSNTSQLSVFPKVVIYLYIFENVIFFFCIYVFLCILLMVV